MFKVELPNTIKVGFVCSIIAAVLFALCLPFWIIEKVTYLAVLQSIALLVELLMVVNYSLLLKNWEIEVKDDYFEYTNMYGKKQTYYFKDLIMKQTKSGIQIAKLQENKENKKIKGSLILTITKSYSNYEQFVNKFKELSSENY